MDLKILEEIGFTKGETKVYSALLELGESTIGQISKNSNITPSKTYPILDKLIKKGLITSIIKGDIKHFQAFNPNRLLNYISEKRRKLQEEEEQIKEILPILSAKHINKAEYSSSVYESMKGLKTLYEEMTDDLKETKEDFIAFTLGAEYEDPKLMRFFKHYDLIRKEEGIKTKLIGLNWQKKFFSKELKRKSGIEIKYLPYASVPQGVIIVGDRVATMIWSDNPVAFVIQAKPIAQAYKKFFWNMWKIAKK